MSKSKEVAITSGGMSNVPDYLKDPNLKSGLNVDSDDVIIPKIKVLQGMSPELGKYDNAKPGIFWHDGANISLGKTVVFVPAVASKKVLLWEPTPSGVGGRLLAYSKNGRDWATGGNKAFEVTPRNSKEKTTWRTGKSVAASGLLDWGSSDPANDTSAPAATLVYDFCCYMPGHPNLSPSLFGLYKTATLDAKKLNTQLLMLRKPIQSVVITASIIEKNNKSGNKWYGIDFSLSGYVPDKATFDLVMELNVQYSSYVEDYTHEESKQDMGVEIGDSIKY